MTYEYHFGISVRVRRVKIFRRFLKLWAHFLRSRVSSSYLFVPNKLSISREEYPLPWKICQYVRQSKCWYLVTLLTCLIVVSMGGKKQNGASENWTFIMYTPFFDTPFLFLEVFFVFLPTYRIYHKGYSDEGQRSRYTRKMDEGHSAILGKIHEPSLSCVLCYGRIATDCSSVRCRKSQMDKPKKRVTVPRYNGVTNKAIIRPHLPPIHPYCPSLQNLKNQQT